MLRLDAARPARFCDGVTRRDFLHAGAISALGLTLADCFQPAASASDRAPATDVNCIMLFLVGGPSHIDTWDPKPNAPAEVRGPFQPTATNVTGLFHITQAVLAVLLAQRSGHVVNVTASIVDQPLASVPAGLAALTKGGLNGLTKSLAIEVAKRGVRVNAVAPGLIKTPMHASGTHEFLAKLVPVGRMGEVKDIVDAVLYLESASFVTGEICHVDGGQAVGVG